MQGTNSNFHVSNLTKQRDFVKKQMNLPMKEGDLWYILDCNWWDKWRDFVNYETGDEILSVHESDFPLKVDNSHIMANKQLKQNLFVNKDIVFVPKSVWEEFAKFYGCVHNDASIFERRALVTPKGLCDLDLYPPHFVFKSLAKPEPYFEHTFSKTHTIENVKSVIKSRLNFPDSVKIRLVTHNGEEIDEAEDTTLSEMSLDSEKELYIQFLVGEDWRDELTANSNSTHSTSFNSSSRGSHFENVTVQRIPLVSGLCGLRNLGNTCFMNSAIQCMSNVPPLTRYFLGSLSGGGIEKWREEINTTNPLGMQGRIATAYADLIKLMWLSTVEVQIPRTFKTEVARFAPQFSGYAQHDSQELMMFVLDGLHEGLNRILKKPYIEAKDSDGRPDEVVAAESWNMHKARNDSIIVDLFHGQLKSTVVCPSCNYVSVTFDPYASLSLPLPDQVEHKISIVLWPYHPSQDPKHCKTSSLLSYVVTLNSRINPYQLSQALSRIRRPGQDMKYYFAVVKEFTVEKLLMGDLKEFDHSTSWIAAYELPEGHPIQVRFKEHQDSYMRWVGLPCFITIPTRLLKNREVLSDKNLRANIDMRLHALSLIGPYSLTSTGKDSNESADCQDVVVEQLNSDKKVVIDRTSEHLYTIGKIQNEYHRDVPMFIEVTVLDQELAQKLQSVHADNSLPAHNEAYTFRKSYDSITRNLNLDDCLRRFTEEERLGERDLWYCKKCKGEQQALKKFDLWSLPNVLVVHLKRFRSEYRYYDKNDSMVQFPITGLDMTGQLPPSKQNEQSYVYDLVAVSNHMGGLGGGHYTAYAKNALTNKWYLFDDSCVREAVPSRVVSPSAYVLVYVRQGLEKSHHEMVAASVPNGISSPASDQASNDSANCSDRDMTSDEEDTRPCRNGNGKPSQTIAARSRSHASSGKARGDDDFDDMMDVE